MGRIADSFQCFCSSSNHQISLAADEEDEGQPVSLSLLPSETHPPAHRLQLSPPPTSQGPWSGPPVLFRLLYSHLNWKDVPLLTVRRGRRRENGIPWIRPPFHDPFGFGSTCGGRSAVFVAGETLLQLVLVLADEPLMSTHHSPFF